MSSVARPGRWARTRPWLWRAIALVVAVGAALASARGARSINAGKNLPPLSSSVATAPSAAPQPAARFGAGGEQVVALRLIDELGRASVETPPPESVKSLDSYWRRHAAPFTRLRGPRAAMVQHVALAVQPTSAREGIVHGVTRDGSDGGVARLAQRECIVAPTPTRIALSIDVPPGARFETELAVIGANGPIAFEVAVTDGPERRVLATEVLDPKLAKRWQPLSVDLSAQAGRRVELELRTYGPIVLGWRPAALWAAPRIVAPAPSRGLSVLWIAVDALRSDAIGATHDEALDGAMTSGKEPPLDAWLPKIPGLTPRLDALAASGALFTRAWSAATWSRPGTLAMLSGSLSADLRLSTLPWAPTLQERRAFYSSDPPLLPRLLRDVGYATAALVNNFYMVGHAPLGLDMGFEALSDFRHQTLDTPQIVAETRAFLGAHRDRRFALYLHLNSPHSPYSPPKHLVPRLPQPPAAPSDVNVRRYLLECAKDDAAIGEIVDELDRLGMGERTLVIVTADHGETLSAAHDAQVFLDGMPMQMRFRHAPAIWEETARVPIVLRLPRVVPAGLRVAAPVQNHDLLPTFLELAGLPIPARVTGRSLVPLLRGGSLPERAVVVEGRGARSLQRGGWRVVEREEARVAGPFGRGFTKDPELYDLLGDPGERRNLASTEKERTRQMIAELRERLGAGAPAATPAPNPAPAAAPRLARIRFAGAGAVRRIRVELTLTEGGFGPPRFVATVARPSVDPTTTASDGTVKVEPTTTARLGLELDTAPQALVGFDVELRGGGRLEWKLELDGRAFPAENVYLGSFGHSHAALAPVLSADDLRALMVGASAPDVLASDELGAYFVVDASGVDGADVSGPSDAAAAETMKLLQEWGYAAKPGASAAP